jgi:hypothetical protein
MVSERFVTFSTTEDVWRRALARAAARPYQVEYVGSRPDAKGVTISYWRVSSNTTPDDWHSVAVMKLATGYAVVCDCLGGQHHKVCAHAALVLVELGILDDPDPAGVALPVAA